MRPFLPILLLVWPAVATAQLAGIEGRVVIEGDVAPLQGATVAWSEGTKLRTLLTNAWGTFSVPPSGAMPLRLAGEYYVVAIDAADLDVPAGELQEPQLLRAVTPDAFRVSVRDGARQPVSLSVSSAR